VGVVRLLGEVADELRVGRYRPLPARWVLIPKPGAAEQGPLSIPTCLARLPISACQDDLRGRDNRFLIVILVTSATVITHASCMCGVSTSSPAPWSALVSAEPPGLAAAGASVLEELDLSGGRGFLASYRADGKAGAAYHPAVLLGLTLYCYSKGIRSSRKIEAACWDDVGVPDHYGQPPHRPHHDRSVHPAAPP
jgi:hypothetical protein